MASNTSIGVPLAVAIACVLCWSSLGQILDMSVKDHCPYDHHGNHCIFDLSKYFSINFCSTPINKFVLCVVLQIIVFGELSI